jgi:hypothetical protein
LFYASGERISNFKIVNTREKTMIQEIMKLENEEMNTLENRVLEKYVDVRDIFNIPIERGRIKYS